MKKRFHLGNIISITHGRLLCSMDNVYKILDFLTGASLFTHQLPRAAESCTPALLEQVPALKELVISDGELTEDNYKKWLKDKAKLYGTWHELIPIASEHYEARDPIEELKEMVDPAKIIVVQTDE